MIRRTRRQATHNTSGRALRMGGAVVVALLSSACVAAAAFGSASAKPVLTIGVNMGPVSFDPAKGNGFYPLTTEGLMHVRLNGSYGPGLATSWRYLPAKPGSGLANKIFEVTIRRNARFSDGTPVTAQAVKTWLEYYTGAGNGPLGSFIGSIASVETIGRFVARIHLKSPNPAMVFALSLPSGYIASPKCVANPTLFASQSCGAGPYMANPSQSVVGDHYTLVPNPYYYDKSKVKYSKVVIRVITNPATMLQAFQTGQVEIAAGDPSTDSAAASSGAIVIRSPGQGQPFTFDVGGSKSKPLADVRVRQALSYAVDRKTIAAALYGKDAVPISDMGSGDGQDSKYHSFYAYDKAKAKSLLVAAGYPNGFSIDDSTIAGWAGTSGTPLAQTVAKYFAAVGVTLKLNVYPTFGDWANAVLTNPSPMIDFGAGYGGNWPMWTIYSSLVKPGSIFNRIGPGWNDKSLFNLWVKGSRAADPMTYWKQMTARLTTQAYFLPLIETTTPTYVSKKIGGVKGGPVGPLFQDLLFALAT